MTQQRINEIVGFIYMAIAILVLASLMTYEPADLEFFASTANVKLHNFVGIIGAYIGAILFFLIGWSAYIIPFLCFVWAIDRFTSQQPQRSLIKFSGTAVLFLAASSFLALIFNGVSIAKMKAGGIFGMFLSSLLDKYFGTVGSYVIVIMLMVLSILLATEFLIIPFFGMLIKKANELYQEGREKRIQAKVQKTEIRTELKKPVLKKAISNADDSKPQQPISPKIKIDKKHTQFLAGEEQSLAGIEPKTAGEYKLPSLELLDSPPPTEERQIKEDLTASSAILEDTLRDFGIEVRVAQVEKGPVITRYELEPAPGVKVNTITALNDDIALAMKAQSVRIIAPIPGKSRVGIEVPNSTASLVYLKEVLLSSEFQGAKSKLTLALGKDTAGVPVVCDLAKMPHILIAGTTGSGKTVCVNSIILSMLYKASPDELKFILVDPKMVEMAMFNSLPHLICPVITSVKKASGALSWLVNEMESRYKLLAKVASRNIVIFNQKAKQGKFRDDADVPDNLPYIVLVIDELADLMAVASNEIENAITRLAQLSRAVGIHIILATQRPSVDVITGVIKANFPARISFKVASKVDSRTVLDMNGADKLLGRGDMLFMEPSISKPIRAQSSLVADNEIERVIDFIASQREMKFEEGISKLQEKKSFRKGNDKDELFDDAVRLIMEAGQASVSMLQRRMRLSYTRAARIIDSMEEEALIGPYCGSRPREILVDREEYLSIAKQEEKEGETAGEAV
jgi:S-DNA-T family DNA segregation ATPase FtsK/SpoIIIE